MIPVFFWTFGRVRKSATSHDFDELFRCSVTCAFRLRGPETLETVLLSQLKFYWARDRQLRGLGPPPDLNRTDWVRRETFETGMTLDGTLLHLYRMPLPCPRQTVRSCTEPTWILITATELLLAVVESVIWSTLCEWCRLGTTWYRLVRHYVYSSHFWRSKSRSMPGGPKTQHLLVTMGKSRNDHLFW